MCLNYDYFKLCRHDKGEKGHSYEIKSKFLLFQGNWTGNPRSYLTFGRQEPVT